MEKLLSNYSVSEILMFIVVLFLAIKEFVGWIDWAKDRIRTVYDKDYNAKADNEKIKDEIKDLKKFDEGVAETNKSIDAITKLIDMLIESDKESIKAFITEKHHYFVYEQKWIDDYSMDCLEKRYAIYGREHGNSFAEALMNELRELPRRPPSQE